MKKYKKVAINIAFLTLILSAGTADSYLLSSSPDLDIVLPIKKMAKYSQQMQEKILNTFENRDYEAWKNLIGNNSKILTLINQSSFHLFADAREAARNGNYNKALKFTEQLKKGLI